MTITDSRERFTDRVADYIRYRPGYPSAAIDALCARIPDNGVVADIGSGTGIFTRLLLAQELTVYAVEPNAAMRDAAEASLGRMPGFVSVDAQAESTGLDDQSVDLVTAAQAFHWFHNDRARAEFVRILKPGGMLALIWNRRDQRDAFQQAYHALLLDFSPEYESVNHMNRSDAELATFFRDPDLQIHCFANRQRLDRAGIIGRIKSASYCPAEDSPQFRRLADGIDALLLQHGKDGEIDFAYETRLYLGRLEA